MPTLADRMQNRFNVHEPQHEQGPATKDQNRTRKPLKFRLPDMMQARPVHLHYFAVPSEEFIKNTHVVSIRRWTFAG